MNDKLLNGNKFQKSADVVVVGGGVIGTAITYFLARDGVDVCLLERYDIAAGTSSAAAAAALLQTKTSPKKLALARKSLDLLDDLYEQLDQQFEYEHSGSLLVASSETEMNVVKDMVALSNRLGLDVQLIDGDEARSIMPILGPAAIGASYSPRDAVLNPLKLVVAYATAARRLGANIRIFTEVIDIETDNNRILSVLTNKGKIYTNTVINAAGVWATQLAKMVGIDLPVTPLKGELLITQPMPPVIRGTLISAKYLLGKAKLEKSGDEKMPKRSVGITLAQVERGNCIVGSTREQAGFDRQSSHAGISELACQLLELVPRMGNVHLIRAYAGLRPITPDGLPIIGRVPKLPGFVIAAGYGGDGLALSAVTAEIISEIFNDTADSDTLASFSPSRFSAIQVDDM